MLSYRHGYHAGNPADVFKHSVLIALLKAMQAKDSAITCIDSHAGPALYDLDSTIAQKTEEYKAGIARLWSQQPDHVLLKDYLEAVRAVNPDRRLRYYPGSPMIMKHLLREQDRMILCELHPGEQQALKRHFAGERRVRLHLGDGHSALKQYLPPKSRRALVLIDPSFELKDEVESISKALEQALLRFAVGVYVIWYPVIDGRDINIDTLPRTLKLDPDKWLNLAIDFPENQRLGRMSGCGMAIINCPFSARQTLQQLQVELSQPAPC